MEFDRYSHSLGESNYHFQFTPKYRRDVFRDVILKKACEESFLRIAIKYRMIVRALEFGPDHVHLFIGNCKKYSVPQIAQYFKGASSRELREQYWEHVRVKEYGDSFWSDGYFYESVGRVTSESVEYYINRQQGKHWANIDYEVYQKSLLSFMWCVQAACGICCPMIFLHGKLSTIIFVFGVLEEFGNA